MTIPDHGGQKCNGGGGGEAEMHSDAVYRQSRVCSLEIDDTVAAYRFRDLIDEAGVAVLRGLV